MTKANWMRQIKGEDCPFCAPRREENNYWKKIVSLNVASLYLNKNQAYRGYSLLIFDKRHVLRASQLDKKEWALLCEDLYHSQIAIEKSVNPDHMNISALGNQIAHLHWHLIPRYYNDLRWGGPIWTTKEEEMVSEVLSSNDFNSLVDSIRENIKHIT